MPTGAPQHELAPGATGPATPRRRSKVAGALRIVSASVAASIALVGLAEGAARLLTRAPAPIALTHPFLGNIRPGGLRQDKLDAETGAPFVLEFDALGFRGKALQTVEKPAGTYRIFFLGASTTQNAELPEEATFPGIVEAKLAERFHGTPRIEVGNAGTQGATSAHSLAEVAERILELHPDLVLVLDATSNDMSDSFLESWDPSTFHLAREVEVPKAREWILQQSRLWQLWDNRVGGRQNPDPRATAQKRRAARAKRPILEPTFDLCRGIPAFARHQQRLVRLCKAEGVAVALMTQPTLLKPELSPEEDERLWATVVPGTDYNLRPATLLRVVEAYNDSIRATSTAEGAILVDLARSVPRELASFADDFHLTRKGNAAIAGSVLAKLLETGELPKEPARNSR